VDPVRRSRTCANKGIHSVSRVEAPQQAVHYDREAL